MQSYSIIHWKQKKISISFLISWWNLDHVCHMYEHVCDSAVK